MLGSQEDPVLQQTPISSTERSRHFRANLYTQTSRHTAHKTIDAARNKLNRAMKKAERSQNSDDENRKKERERKRLQRAKKKEKEAEAKSTEDVSFNTPQKKRIKAALNRLRSRKDNEISELRLSQEPDTETARSTDRCSPGMSMI